MINRRPAVIARCAGAADVVQCVRFAREHDVLVSVRGGGHSVAGKSVCDVTLPGLNGLGLQQLVADRHEMPIIFISGYGDVPMSVRAMRAGAVEFLIKPFGDEMLLSVIRLAIERSNIALRQAAKVRVLQDRCASLTRRELEVISIAAGFVAPIVLLGEHLSLGEIIAGLFLVTALALSLVPRSAASRVFHTSRQNVAG